MVIGIPITSTWLVVPPVIILVSDCVGTPPLLLLLLLWLTTEPSLRFHSLATRSRALSAIYFL
jgi:hypothetical protein